METGRGAREKVGATGAAEPVAVTEEVTAFVHVDLARAASLLRPAVNKSDRDRRLSLYCALDRRRISIPGFGEGDALRPVLSPVSDHSAFNSAKPFRIYRRCHQASIIAWAFELCRKYSNVATGSFQKR